MFNPIKLATSALAIFRRGFIYDRFVTDTTIMKMDAVGLLRVFDAATAYRNAIVDTRDSSSDPTNPDTVINRAWQNLCDALDGMKPYA